MEINDEFLRVIAGDVERLLIENKESIQYAYGKMGGELKISLGISLSESGVDVITVNYDLGHDLELKPDPPAKHKVKFKRKISDQPALDMEFLSLLPT